MWSSLVVLLSVAVAVRSESPGSLPVGSKSILHSWFQDPVIRQRFIEFWRREEYPLTAALRNPKAVKDVSSRCLEDLNFMVDSRDLQMLTMLDASVKVPEGLLSAAWTHLGNWAQCVGVQNVETPSGGFDGQMCMVTYRPSLASTASARNGTQREAFSGFLSQVSLRLAHCVPSTCSAADVQAVMSTVLQNPVQGVTLSVSVTERDCTLKDGPEFDTSDWVAVGLLIFLGVITASSTLYDVLTPVERKKPVPAAFSVISNGKKLLAPPSGAGDQSLSCLHGLRFLSMVWVVLGHRYMHTIEIPVINSLDLTAMLEEWYRVGITNAPLAVDTFFAVTGLLVGYLFFKQPPAKRALNIPLYYLHRYVRLTPAFALVVLLTATLAYHVGWGPLWDDALLHRKDRCREYWWSSLLYVANYVNPSALCVGQGWYLMVDMQLHWLSPIVLIPLVKKPKVGMILVAALCVASLIGNFVLSYVTDMGVNAISINDPDDKTFFNSNFYYPTHTRFVTYLEGLALGYYMGEQKYLGKKAKELNFVFATIGWVLVAALLLVPLFLGYEFVSSPMPSKLPTAFYNSLHRPVWGLGILLLVYLCYSGNGRPVNSLLSWWGFQILGRFSYCVYLMHMVIIEVQRGTVMTEGYFSDHTVLFQVAGDVVFSLLAAGVLSVLTESPFIVLEKHLLGGHQKKGNTQKSPIAPAANEMQGVKVEEKDPKVIE